MLPSDLSLQVAAALREDLGGGDLTAALVPAAQLAAATVITREQAVLCGSAWFDETFRQLDPAITVSWQMQDGATVGPGMTLCTVRGPARPILSGERTALNFLQLLSGTATAASRFVAAVAGSGCRILDTRKTLPGLRSAQKYATRCGGVQNHRMGLYDQVLIKENHITAAGSILAAVQAARRSAPGVVVEVEVENLVELEQALAARPEIVMLDEFSLADLRAAAVRNRALGSPVRLEASGSVSLDGVREIAGTGVDFISVGSITKHVRATDLSMRLQLSSAGS
ncbi:MAG: carboxylating nicotinate-nucleotide diphosphorylase [Gammaproteobacteria bacterium]|nr:carboxylating nicotinate-nucleotide diphosphorylase [Gammaproteobacteria bacterium]